MLRPLGIFFLSRVALLGAIEVARRFLILPVPRPNPACLFGLCEPNGWVPLSLAAGALAVAVVLLWGLVRRRDGADAASAAVGLFLASPLTLVLALDAGAAAATALGLLALWLAARHGWLAGLPLAAAALLVPAAALMAPAVVLAAWAADPRGMRVNAVLVSIPPAAMLAAGAAGGSLTAPLVAAPWLQVGALMAPAVSAGGLIHWAGIAVVGFACLVAFATRSSVAGLAGTSWLAFGLILGAPVAAHLGACAASPWGPVSVVLRRWGLEAPVTAGLFMLQGLWLFHLVHGLRLL